MANDVLLFGASGHAKVLIDILERQGERILGLVDDDPALTGTVLLGYAVLGGRERVQALAAISPLVTIVGIGANGPRMQIAQWLGEQGLATVTAIHPGAQIARDTRIGAGSTVMAGCVVNPSVEIGVHAIINTGACVDHDCFIADFAHVAPGCHLCGGVRVGKGVLVGVGANVVPGVRIGDWATVGAGAVVIRDVPPGGRVAGNPAAPISRR